MYSSEFLHTLHGELARAVPACTVLLGGSYIYGEPTSKSDVDFFIVCPYDGWLGLKKKLRTFKEKYTSVPVNLMTVPKWMMKRGWYYVYGRTIHGELITSGFDKQMMVTSALKLAYFTHVQYLLAKNREEQEKYLGKIAQKIALIHTVLAYDQQETPPLSYSRTLEYVPATKEYEWVREVLKARQENREINDIPLDFIIKEMLEHIYTLSQSYLVFSWHTYTLYNVKFLLKGNGLFLFDNPDTIVLQKMRNFLQQGGDLQEHYNEMREIVFPVIMI